MKIRLQRWFIRLAIRLTKAAHWLNEDSYTEIMDGEVSRYKKIHGPIG